MLVHWLLLVGHLILHVIKAFVSGSRKDFAQYVIISFVGCNFFMHAFKRTSLDEDPNVGVPSNSVYAIISLYML